MLGARGEVMKVERSSVIKSLGVIYGIDENTKVESPEMIAIHKAEVERFVRTSLRHKDMLAKQYHSAKT